MYTHSFFPSIQSFLLIWNHKPVHTLVYKLAPAFSHTTQAHCLLTKSKYEQFVFFSLNIQTRNYCIPMSLKCKKGIYMYSQRFQFWFMLMLLLWNKTFSISLWIPIPHLFPHAVNACHSSHFPETLSRRYHLENSIRSNLSSILLLLELTK